MDISRGEPSATSDGMGVQSGRGQFVAFRWPALVVLSMLAGCGSLGRERVAAGGPPTAEPVGPTRTDEALAEGRLKPAVPAGAGEPTAPLPFGLTCSQCMYTLKPADCSYLANLPVIALASGAREVEVLTYCDPSTGHPNDARQCAAQSALYLDSLKFWRNESQAGAADLFYMSYGYEISSPELKENIYLRPDRRYVVFATAAFPETRPPAKWHISAACEWSSSEQLP